MDRKKKDVWYDADTANKSTNKKPKNKFPEFKNLNCGSSKILKQTKISDLLKNKAPPTAKADLSQLLKDYSEGLSSSQSLNGAEFAWENKDESFSLLSVPTQTSSSSQIKRKSDEQIESYKKRERPQTTVTVSKIEVSPMKLNVIASPSRKDRSGWTLSSQPSSEPSTSTNVSKNKSMFDGSAILFESPEPEKEKEFIKKEQKQSRKSVSVSDFTLDLLKGFDNIGKEEPQGPNFRYKEPVVRKKAERAKLRGWDCDECRAYYEGLESQMDPREIEKLKDKCSKHRFKEKPISNTPENFWCTQFPTTEELYADGYIQVCTPFTPKGRYRRRRNSDSQIEYADVDDVNNVDETRALSSTSTHFSSSVNVPEDDESDQCSFSLLSGIRNVKKSQAKRHEKAENTHLNTSAVTQAAEIPNSPIRFDNVPSSSQKWKMNEEGKNIIVSSSTPGRSTPAKTANNALSFPISPIVLFDSPNTCGKSEKMRKCVNKKENINDFTFNLLKDFDNIRPEEPPSPNFRYKEPVVRKKAERAKLRGWDCDECRAYYEGLESQMDPKEIERLRDNCSKHRFKHKPVSNTPENFWCTYFPNTEELYADGYIQVGTPFVPKGRYRRNSDSEIEYVDD